MWNEENLHYNEMNKTAKMKINEPKTPYVQYVMPPNDEFEEDDVLAEKINSNNSNNNNNNKNAEEAGRDSEGNNSSSPQIRKHFCLSEDYGDIDYDENFEKFHRNKHKHFEEEEEGEEGKEDVDDESDVDFSNPQNKRIRNKLSQDSPTKPVSTKKESNTNLQGK